MNRRGYEPEQRNLWTKILLGLAGLIFVVLIGKFIGSSTANATLETAVASLRLPDTTSSAEITTSDNKQKDVNANTPLSTLDFIEVKSGTAQVTLLSDDKDSLNLNAGTNLRFLWKQSDGKSQFRLENKDLWVQSDTADFSFDLIGVTLIPSSTTVLNISKNELFTTITVLQGSATISLSGSTQEITAGKQLNYSSLKTLTPEDLATRIAPISPDALSSDWMKANGASAYMSATTATTPSPTDTSTSAGSLVLFDSPVDESTVKTKTVTVSGRVLSPNVSKVVINGMPTTVDPAKQTFTMSPLTLTAKENNLIYRTFDVSGTLLSKGVITVYSNDPSLATASTVTTDGGGQQIQNYKPDSRFKIVAPSSDFFETRDTKVKIEGAVSPKLVHHITINDFKLSSFTPNGSSWYYFANEQFGTMAEGVNTYVIRYFDAQDTELYRQLFIIKKLPTVTATATTTAVSASSLTSGEVTR